MSLFKIFEVSGSAMSAQSVRLNTTASNLANANNIASSTEEAYKARQPLFAAMLDEAKQGASAAVQVTAIVESDKAPHKEYSPGHPLADGEGYIYRSNVNPVEELANMISASRSFQNSAEVLNTAKDLAIKTINLGQG